MNARIKAYLLTFFGYIFFHSLMTAYSFVSPYFQQTYKLPDLFMGGLDGTLYFAKGIGYLLRYRIIKQSKIMKHFMISSLIFLIAFFLFPFFSLTHVLTLNNVQSILFILITIYGFFLFNNWPVSLSIISNYYTTQNDGSKLGFWSADGDFGSMFGFLFPSLLILQFQWTWQVPLIILCILTLIFCLAIYLFIPEQNKNQSLQQQNATQDENLWQQFKDYFFQFFKKPNFILFTLILCCYRALTYTFLLWLPTYVDSKRHQNYSAVLSIIFNIGTILGSYCLGKVYQIKSQRVNNSLLVQYVFVFIGFIVMIGFIIMIEIDFSVIAFGFLIAIQGFGIGGFYNMLTCNQVMREVGDDEKELNFFTVVTASISCMFVGVIMFVIGAYMNANSDNPNAAADDIFKVALGVSILGIFLLVIRLIQKKKKNLIRSQNELQQQKIQQKVEQPNQNSNEDK